MTADTIPTPLSLVSSPASPVVFQNSCYPRFYPVYPVPPLSPHAPCPCPPCCPTVQTVHPSHYLNLLGVLHSSPHRPMASYPYCLRSTNTYLSSTHPQSPPLPPLFLLHPILQLLLVHPDHTVSQLQRAPCSHCLDRHDLQLTFVVRCTTFSV